MWHPADQFAGELEEPVLYTFTAPLSFPLGIPDSLGHTIQLQSPFADPADLKLFGPGPTVDIRVFTFKEGGLPTWPVGLHDALRHFYAYDFEGDPADRHGQGSLDAHHQWVSFETPSAPTVEELNAADSGFAFHRCLFAFNLFLRAAQVATRDIRIRPISTHDLRPLVVIGARGSDGSWELLSTMFMHPEAQSDWVPLSAGRMPEDRLIGGLEAVQNNHPYLTTALWRSRAQRAVRQDGDASEAIISFQIAAESLLFDTLRMLLVDEGLTSGEVQAELDKERSFKSLLTTTMPSKLGGRWDVTASNTPVGAYWEQLYEVRNAVVHRGYEPHGGEAEAAQAAYRGLLDHLEDRLRKKRTVYPRTVLARLDRKGLERCGVLSRRMKRFLAEVESESAPWYWAYDSAGREPPSEA